MTSPDRGPFGALRGASLLFVARVPEPLLNHPFEVVVAMSCVLSGVPYVATGTAPQSVESALPTWLVRSWGVELLVGGVLILAGVLGNRRNVERAGLHLLGASCLAYAAILAVVVGRTAGAAGAIIAAVGLACFARATVLSATLRMAALVQHQDRRHRGH